MDKFTDEQAIAWADKKLMDPHVQTDGGCTMSPNFNFKDCCIKHDVMMNYDQGIKPRQAHRILRKCVASRGHKYLAWLYWTGVSFSSMVGGPINAVFITFVTAIAGFVLWTN